MTLLVPTALLYKRECGESLTSAETEQLKDFYYEMYRGCDAMNGFDLATDAFRTLWIKTLEKLRPVPEVL